MPSATLYSKTGVDLGTVELPEVLFNAEINEALMHQAVTAQLAGRRTGTHSTKTRGQVRGGGAKPYKQKGTGRARQGSKSAPHYAGGGVVFGPHPRSYEQKLPKRMKRAALHGALTAKYTDDAIRVVDELGLDAPKTRDFAGFLVALRANGRILVVATGSDANLALALRNLPQVVLISADSLNIVDVINADTILITQQSLDTMAEIYA
ncbi:MAG: 50S ribosomal protein L4 [Candidatus Limnocylindrales bacterium]